MTAVTREIKDLAQWLGLDLKQGGGEADQLVSA
jgi:hypothetical protein